VQDDRGATDTATATVRVKAAPGPTPGPIPGMPELDKPGIYVWGDPQDHWHITVVGSPDWVKPHAFRIELRTDGKLKRIVQTSRPGTVSIGKAEWRKLFEHTVKSNVISYIIQAVNSTSLYMSFEFDIDGDGILEQEIEFVYLRALKVNPPINPFVVALPSGYRGPLVPSLNFRIGVPLRYDERNQFVEYQTDIETLEGR